MRRVTLIRLSSLLGRSSLIGLSSLLILVFVGATRWVARAEPFSPVETFGRPAGSPLLSGMVQTQENDAATAIIGGRVHTVSGAVLENATILIESGRIRAVGTSVAIPSGARRIAAAGKVVTPGFIIAESQLGLVEVSLEAATRDTSAEEDPVTAAFRVIDGLNPHSTLIPITRVEGITTAVSVPSGGLIAGQSAVINLITDPGLVLRSPAAMHANFGSFRGARGAAALRLRELLEDARFYRSNRFRYDMNQTRELSASRLDLDALVQVLEDEIPLVVKASRMSDIQAVLAIAQEFGIRRLILSGGAEAWMLAEELAARQVPVIVGQLSNLPSSFGSLGQRFDNAAILQRAGVKIALVNPSAHDARRIKQEAGNAVRHGLPWDAALRAVTLSPAEMFGLEDDLGSLEAGKVANVVVWSGDPFEFSTAIEHVFIRGEDVCCFSRQQELLRRYRNLDRNQPPAYR